VAGGGRHDVDEGYDVGLERPSLGRYEGSRDVKRLMQFFFVLVRGQANAVKELVPENSHVCKFPPSRTGFGMTSLYICTLIFIPSYHQFHVVSSNSIEVRMLGEWRHLSRAGAVG
jgi:hypothetical protein